MITQSINLNLITGQVLPRVNASQYDNNTRTLTMYLYDGELTFNIPSGVSGYIQGTKPDRTGFQYSTTVTAGSNVVTFDITEQMTAVAGDVTCELVLVDGDDRIATVNFILHVEPAALSDDTVISETELPLIEEAAGLAQQIGGFIEQMDADAAKSEAYGAGTVNGVPVTSDNPAYENNAKYYSDEASASASSVGQLKEDSEAYAVGTRDGVPVASGDAAYRNNSKFYANAASGSAATAVASETAAAASEENAEAWAVGERDGEPVTSGDVTYHNNSKYYAGKAANSASNAGLSESAAAQSEEDAEAWAVGERNGVAVPSTDPAFQNNAKYYAQQAGGTANDMIGATATTDGAHGLVPQPLAGEQNKFLRGDGSWADSPPNPNLLDNPWFTVNQREFTSTTQSQQYTVDRWKITYNPEEKTISHSNGIITILGGATHDTNFTQYIEDASSLVGKVCTFSVLRANGSVEKGTFIFPTNNAQQINIFIADDCVAYCQYPVSGFAFLYIGTRRNKSISIKAVKLELGSVSTLAMDTAPNYATELLKCQRYFYAFNGKPNLTSHSYAIIGTGYATSTNNIRLPFYLPIEMRIVPTVSVSALPDVVIMSELADAAAPSAIALDSASCDRNNIGLFNITSNGNFVKGHSASVYTKSGCRIDLSADL